MADPEQPATAPTTADSGDAHPVPTGRLHRLARLGSLAGGIATGVVAHGARQWLQGARPSLSDLILTPRNARRMAEELSKLRGAAMKVGQLLSLDAGDLIPPELAEILAQLRANATPMPMSQVVAVLEREWGPGWNERFRQFSFTPAASASIGQVHFGETREGRPVALKIQYPGVRESIDSDVDNVRSLLRFSGLLPAKLNLDPLMAEAKRQLHGEADYAQEGAWLAHYGQLLAEDSAFQLPSFLPELSTPRILAMGRVAGVPVEHLAAAAPAERNRAMTALFRLLFREIFEFRLIQTDPNFANFRHDPATGQIILLDFGATRPYPDTLVAAYRRLMGTARHGDFATMDEAATAIGYFQEATLLRHRQAVVEVFHTACEPLRHHGPYDFGRSDLAARIRDLGMALGRDRDFWHTPPADALFLHRKLGGLYLLAARLKAAVDVAALAAPYLDSPSLEDPVVPLPPPL